MFLKDPWNQETLPEVKDAEKLASASDLFRTGACMLGRQHWQKLRCVHRWWHLTWCQLGDHWISVADCQCLNIGGSLLASDLFRTGACILGRQQKWRCVHCWCQLGDCWISVADCKCLNIEGSLRRIFAEVIRILTNFTCLKVLEIIFETPETRKIQTKIMRAQPGT